MTEPIIIFPNCKAEIKLTHMPSLRQFAIGVANTGKRAACHARILGMPT